MTGPRSPVTAEQFRTLLTTPLGVTAFLEELLADNDVALDRVRRNRRDEATFAAVASWAVWEPVRRGTPGVRARSQVKEHLADFDRLRGTIHGDVVLVAFNKGLTVVPDPDQVADEELPWSNFHAGLNDHKLAAAIEEAAALQARDGSGVRDWLTGAYLTDFYKGLPTRDLDEFEEFCDLLTTAQRAAIDAEMARLLRQELALLGGRAVVVSIGRDPGLLVAEHAPEVPLAASRLMHYAARQYDPDVYRAQVLALNAELQSRFVEER